MHLPHSGPRHHYESAGASATPGLSASAGVACGLDVLACFLACLIVFIELYSCMDARAGVIRQLVVEESRLFEQPTSPVMLGAQAAMLGSEGDSEGKE
jgi:hypothetical protein